MSSLYVSLLLLVGRSIHSPCSLENLPYPPPYCPCCCQDQRHCHCQPLRPHLVSLVLSRGIIFANVNPSIAIVAILQICIQLVVVLKVEIAAIIKANVDLIAIIKLLVFVKIFAVIGIYV